MSNPIEDSTPSLDSRLRDEGTGMHCYDLLPDVQNGPNMPPMDPFQERRSITFIASLNSSLAGPRDFVYYDTTHNTNMPALATNSLRLCTAPNDLPPGTDTLTFPGYHQQIASVSGLHASIIEDRSPLLAAAFEDSRSGRRLHLETLSSNTVMPFLRFLYTGSYALFGGWEDVPTSVLLHCKMYWLGDLYDLPELKSQAYVNALRQFEFGCSSPEKPIDLCSAIDFTYQTLTVYEAISDAIVQYCVTQCLSHKLHEDPEFKGLAFNVRAFHQDLTRVCRDRGYEDESSAIIIRLPYKHFAPDTYASLESPPIAGFDDIIHHFHSSDRFDEEATPKARQKLAAKQQAPPLETPQLLTAPKHAAPVAPCSSPDDAKPTIPALKLPIRQLSSSHQAPIFASSQQDKPLCNNTALPFRQLDDDLAKLSTALPSSGFFAQPRTQEATMARTARPPHYGEFLRLHSQESDRLFAKESPFWRSPVAEHRENRETINQKLEDYKANDNKTYSSRRTNGHGFLEARPVKYTYKEFPPWEPQQFNGAPASTEDPFADCMFSKTSQLEALSKLSEKQPIAPRASEYAKEIKRRRVEGQDHKDLDSTHPRFLPASPQLQSARSVAPSSSHASCGQSSRKTCLVNLQMAKVTDAPHFTPSNVSPTLPSTVFGPTQSIMSPSMTNLDPNTAADNTPMPVQAINTGGLQPLPPGLQSHIEPQRIQVPNNMNPRMNLNLNTAVPFPTRANSGNHALQDYQMQLMLLEQQNKKRLLMARQEQDSMSTPPSMPPGAHGQSAPNTSPQGSRAGGPSPNLIEKARAPHTSTQSDHDREVVTGLNASSADERGREVDVLDEFDFDAFLQSDNVKPSAQFDPFPFWQDHQDDKSQLEGLIDMNQRQQTNATHSHRCFSRVHTPTSGHDVPVVQPQTMMLPAVTRKWYGVQLSNLRCGLTDANPSDGPIIQTMDNPLGLTIKASSDRYPDPTPSAEGLLQPARPTSDSEIDMCDSDSDSDTSWIDVSMTEPKLKGNTQSSDTAVASPASNSKTPRTGAKRRSSSSDSEWDFC